MISDAFRKDPTTGLLVPNTDETRRREVWPKADALAFERLTKVLAMHPDLELFLRCRTTACWGKPIERVRLKDGDIALRCAHLDRVFTRAY